MGLEYEVEVSCRTLRNGSYVVRSLSPVLFDCVMKSLISPKAKKSGVSIFSVGSVLSGLVSVILPRSARNTMPPLGRLLWCGCCLREKTFIPISGATKLQVCLVLKLYRRGIVLLRSIDKTSRQVSVIIGVGDFCPFLVGAGRRGREQVDQYGKVRGGRP